MACDEAVKTGQTILLLISLIPLKTHSTLLLLFFYSSTLLAQINPNDITIVRDGYGVPHIYAATDAEVAYGLAWAHAEDDFFIQLAYLAGSCLLSRYNGKAGAPTISSISLFNLKN